MRTKLVFSSFFSRHLVRRDVSESDSKRPKKEIVTTCCMIVNKFVLPEINAEIDVQYY